MGEERTNRLYLLCCIMTLWFLGGIVLVRLGLREMTPHYVSVEHAELYERFKVKAEE